MHCGAAPFQSAPAAVHAFHLKHKPDWQSPPALVTAPAAAGTETQHILTSLLDAPTQQYVSEGHHDNVTLAAEATACRSAGAARSSGSG